MQKVHSHTPCGQTDSVITAVTDLDNNSQYGAEQIFMSYLRGDATNDGRDRR